VNAYTIDLLASMSPEWTTKIERAGLLGQQRRFSPLHDTARDRFLAKYIQTNYGWYIALQFANRGMEFPLMLQGRDLWVHKAYLLRMDPWKNYDQHVVEAYHLAQFVNGAPNLRQHLKAMLLAFRPDGNAETHLREVSLKTGVSVGTLDAFEVLFFNVIDRRSDALYLAQEVYPNTRLVEFDEHYLRNSTHEDLIKRVAYNHRDMDLTAYLSGIGDHTYLRKLAASNDRESELTRFLMGNGLILAHTSLLNQRNVGVSRALTLLAASRQSGADKEEPTLTGIVPIYSEAFRQALSMNKEMVLDQMVSDSGGGYVDV
jgi:hypothetical protein